MKSMDFGLEGKIAIVTGASGGIGAAIAKDLAREGVNLSLSYNSHRCDELLEEIKEFGVKAIAVKADVSSSGEIKGLVEATYKAFSGVDILVNNAGMGRVRGPIEELNEDDWDRLMAVNLKSIFLICKAVIPHLKKRGWGRIINIGSVMAKVGTNARPWLEPDSIRNSSSGAYVASKAGVHALTITLAKELAGFGITVNCIAPGPTKTNMVPSLPEHMKELVPVGRIGLPEEIGAFAVLLASQRAGFITGEIIDVNGGLWMD